MAADGARPRHDPPRVVVRLREVAHPPRVWSPLDAFLYNVMTTNVAVTFGIFLVAGAAFYFPVSSMTLAILISGGFCLCEAVVYAFLVSSMPRNGGDYLFQRRLVSRWAGAVFGSTGIVVGGALWMAIAGWFASRVAVGPFLLLLGVRAHNGALMAAGRWVLTPLGLVALGLAAAVWSAFINLRGMAFYARLQRVLVVAGGAALAVLVTYFAVTKLDTNNSAYSEVLLRAYYDGFLRTGHLGGLSAAVQLLPIVSFGLIYPGWIAFQAGEVRRASSLPVQSATIVLGKIVTWPSPWCAAPADLAHGRGAVRGERVPGRAPPGGVLGARAAAVQHLGFAVAGLGDTAQPRGRRQRLVLAVGPQPHPGRLARAARHVVGPAAAALARVPQPRGTALPRWPS